MYGDLSEWILREAAEEVRDQLLQNPGITQVELVGARKYEIHAEVPQDVLRTYGLTLDQIPYWREGTLDKYTPSGDYVVVKFARWAFEKFRDAQDRLGTQMRAVGEVMSIGKTYKEAFQKAIRSLEIGRHGLGFAKDFHQKSLEELMSMLSYPTSERQFIMYEALRKGATVSDLCRRTYIKPWFIQQMKELVGLEQELLRHKSQELPGQLLVQAKKDGFADKYLAKLMGVAEKEIRQRRTELGVVEAWD